MNARARKRCISQRFYGRFHFSFVWRSTDDHAWDNIAPVGREFGSKDYERLSILDMHVSGTITESRAMELLNVDRAALLDMMGRDGLIRTSVEYEAALKVVSPLVDADPERGTPDGDRLEAWVGLIERYEAQHFSFDESTSAKRNGLWVEIEEAALDNPELPLPFVRDIMVSREEATSGQVLTAYELDDGQSASTQGGLKS